jgi:hypothetical protein
MISQYILVYYTVCHYHILLLNLKGYVIKRQSYYNSHGMLTARRLLTYLANEFT